MKKNQILFAISVIAIISSCGPQGTNVEYEGEVVDQEQNGSVQTKKLNFALGQDIKLGDFIVKVNKITEHKSNNEFLQPEDGYRFVAIEVEYFNPTQDKQLDANPMNWKLFDKEDYSYDVGIMVDHKKPDLNVTTINPNGKLKGWITFEIPKNAIPNKLQFQPNFWDNANIEIALE